MLSAKQYLCLRCGKRTKSTSGFTRHHNACTKEVPQTANLYKFYNDLVDTSDGDLEDGNQLLNETNYTVKDATDLPTKRTPRDGLLTSEFLSLLRKKWFTGKEFPAGILVSDIKYNYLGLKHQNSFYLFNDQLDYTLAHYFAESKTTKGNLSKFLFDLLMTSLTKKLSYKNTDE